MFRILRTLREHLEMKRCSIPSACAALLAFAWTAPVAAGELGFSMPPTAVRNGDATTIRFGLTAPGDVEVALVDPRGRVVRHLAAGVLGGKQPPPAPLAPGLQQSLSWDGKDDDGMPASDAARCKVRVRVGLGVRLERIVGGDPYAFYSEEMGDSDHSPWGVGGLEAKSDGTVYVFGQSSNLGPPALRQYDAAGTYKRTLFPPPAGKDVESMRGWGLHLKPDGTYVPIFGKVSDPSPTTTFLDPGRLGMARLMPTPETDRLVFWSTGGEQGRFRKLRIATDGTIAAKPEDRLLGPLVREPALPSGPVEPGSHIQHALEGPSFTAWTPDGRAFYLGGLYACRTRYGSVLQVERDGFWRDGQVWKVDAATGTARVFFALDAATIPLAGPERVAAYGGSESYAALHGVAVDAAGRVFVCDRLGRRIVVLDDTGRTLRTIPVEHPDAIAVGQRNRTLYVTTRVGDYHRRGTVRLLKYADWQKDDAPAAAIEVSKTGYTGHLMSSRVVAVDTPAGTHVWVAHSQMPVRVYRDVPEGLALVKDFYRVEGAQRCLGFDRLQVDPATETAYLLDSHDSVWTVSDWKSPEFVEIPVRTASIAIDARRRYLFARTLADGKSSNSVGRVARFHLDREGCPPADFGATGTNRLTPPFHYEWCFEGNSDKGLAVAPNGDVAVVGASKEGLRVYSGTESQVPWKAIEVAPLPNNAGGARFDRAGNLYVAFVDGKTKTELPGFDGDRFLAGIGRIHRYAPTGTPGRGPLFPTAPTGPAQVYDVPCGAFESDCVTRSPRFGLDAWGRLYVPLNIEPRVTIVDNAGNEILRFGTYGNRDSLGGRPGDPVPAKDVPLAFPNSVDATDDYVYVADMVNLRLLRLAKSFALQATVEPN